MSFYFVPECSLSVWLFDGLSCQQSRIDAYKQIVASFRPTISVEFFREILYILRCTGYEYC